MPQLDVTTYTSQITWLVITFAALFLVMWRLVVPRIGLVLEARQRRIEDNLDKAQELKTEAQAALAAYEQAMNEARAQAERELAEAAARVSREAAERTAALAARLAADVGAAEQRITRAKEEAVVGVREAVVDVAGTLVERLLGERPQVDALARAVERAMAERR